MNFFLDNEMTAQLLSPEGIPLAPEQIDWALELSQSGTTEAERWQTYLSSLALLGVQEWLQQRSPDLVLKSNWLPDRKLPLVKAGQADQINLSQQVCQLQIGEFKLYLLLTDCLDDPMVAIPKAIFDRSEFAPDFYLLVEVLEELAEVRVYGYLPAAQLSVHAADPSISNLQPDPQTVLLPVDQFTQEVDSLLLHLRHSNVAALRTALAATPGTVSPPVSSAFQVINVGVWLRNRLDRVAEELSWLLLPPVAFNLEGAMMAMRSARSPIEDLDAVITELIRNKKLTISPAARPAYWDFQLGTTAMRLYALGWNLDGAATDPLEWSLLLILGAQPGSHLPSGTVLKIEDAMQVLAEEQLDRAPYLYAQVAGTWDEQFRVTITLPNAETLVLPPFAFNPDAIDSRSV